MSENECCVCGAGVRTYQDNTCKSCLLRKFNSLRRMIDYFRAGY